MSKSASRQSLKEDEQIAFRPHVQTIAFLLGNPMIIAALPVSVLYNPLPEVLKMKGVKLYIYIFSLINFQLAHHLENLHRFFNPEATSRSLMKTHRQARAERKANYFLSWIISFILFIFYFCCCWCCKISFTDAL